MEIFKLKEREKRTVNEPTKDPGWKIFVRLAHRFAVAHGLGSYRCKGSEQYSGPPAGMKCKTPDKK
jgi:hypothetical protein